MRRDIQDLALGVDVDRGVARDTEDARERVQVLVKRQLEHGRTALAIGRTVPQSVHADNGLHSTELQGRTGR